MKVSLSICSALFAIYACAVSPEALEKGFFSPPDDARPHTWWHWMNGNVTKEGITADLEAMHEIGIGGAQIFDAGCNIPPGPISYNTPEWFDVVKHAASEARRLGIELCLPNCSGWSSSGGPWNPAKNGMKFLDWTELTVIGPSAFNGKLKQPENRHGFYEDIAVLAVPVPPAERDSLKNAGAVETREKDGAVVFTFPSVETASGFSCRLRYGHCWSGQASVTVTASEDGSSFKPVLKTSLPLSLSGSADYSLRFCPFPKSIRAKAFRFTFRFPISPKVHVSELRLERKMVISNLPGKTFKARLPVKMETVKTTPDQVVPKDAVINLTSRLAKDGSLTWDVPAGAWKLIRLGYAANGRMNHPASKYGVGYEVDKLSKSALDYHFDAYVAKLCRHLGGLAGDVKTGLNNILVDSYEVGSQNWTQGFEKAFTERTGYEITPWLPVLTGTIVGSLEESERFLWDFRRVVADMFAENYAGALAKKCHEYGLKLSLEPYGNGPSDNLQYGQDVDIPMGEFWSGAGTGNNGIGNARFPAYLAHVWGRKYAGTESFTASPGGGSGRWQKDPFGLKAQGDVVFANGVNRIIYHRFTHQPWVGDKYLPGMTMGKWGMHFDRTQTWWKQGKTWITYQTRCQYLLQEGKIVSDALFYCGENAPNDGGNTDGATGRQVSLPRGYNWDICATEAVRRLKVVDGKIIVPGGVAYRFLVLPESDIMSPGMLKVIGSLIDRGATIVGRVKPSKAPGLIGWPASDAEVVRLADAVWAKGVLTCSAEEALTKLGIAPDFDSDNKEAVYLHRNYGEAGEGYFVAMPNKKSTSFECSFRVTGRRPELWDAETATIVPAPVWRVENGRTFVRLAFRPSGSVFVMFRKPSVGDHIVSLNAHVADVPEVKADTVHHTLVFTKAEYGAFADLEPEDCLNVTERVRMFIGKPIWVANASFGKDPAPNVQKRLLVVGERDGREIRDFVAEHTSYTVPAGSVVKFALYGIPDRDWNPPVMRVVDLTKKLNDNVKDGMISVRLDNQFAGRDPAAMTYKKAIVTYQLDGCLRTAILRENAILALPPAAAQADVMPDFCLKAADDGSVTVSAWKPLEMTMKTASGKFVSVKASVPAPVVLGGPWNLAFPSGRGAPAHVTLSNLISWTEHTHSGVKYFSGTATYTKQASFGRLPAAGERVFLDLGQVKNFAEVTVNGIDYPVLWKPPFRVDVTEAVRKGAGALSISVKVTNLWPNRLIGDELLPDDAEWQLSDSGQSIVEIPQWVKDGKTSPTGRHTFTTWKHWTAGDALLDSGILGPVCLRSLVEAK